MDQVFNRLINLTIIGLGAYLCTYATHERRTALLGVCLIAFGGAFALADYLRGHTPLRH
jgi:hypothetical protein